MANFVVDNFTEGANWVYATSHTPTLGGPISKPASGGGDFYIVNNRALNRGVGYMYYNATPPVADYSVEADIVVFTNGASEGDAGLVGRANTASNSFYYCYINGSGTQLILAVMTNGTAVASNVYAGSFPGSPSGTTYRIKLELIGSALKAYADGVLRCSLTDTSLTAVGKVGIRAPANLSDTYTGKHIDNFVAYDASVAATTARFSSFIG